MRIIQKPVLSMGISLQIFFGKIKRQPYYLGKQFFENEFSLNSINFFVEEIVQRV